MVMARASAIAANGAQREPNGRWLQRMHSTEGSLIVTSCLR